MNKKLKTLPNFSKMTREEEVAFWETADLTDYIDSNELNKHKLIFRVGERKAKDELVAFRLESEDLSLLKGKADELGIGYSTLLRMVVKKYLTKAHGHIQLT